MSNSRILHAVALTGLFVTAGSAQAFDLTASLSSFMDSTASASGGTCNSEVGFSPEGSAARLVAGVLDRARSRVRLAAYTFTSPDVVRRLIAAKRRGVDVAVIADAKENTGGRGARAGQAALNLLVEAGIPVRTVSAYAIHHDKYIVADGETVETGSYNYSTAAARRNSENAVVIANCPSLASAYEAHWKSRWAQGESYRALYGGAGTRTKTSFPEDYIMTTTLMLQQIPVVRDEDGNFIHPDLEHFWRVELGDVERCEPQQWEDLCKRAGIVTKHVSLESEPQDHPAYVSYFDNGSPDITAWDPSPPPGWWLIEIGQTEDGPFAVWATHRLI